MISVREQLSGQLKESEAELTRLLSELSSASDQRGALQQELEAQREKLSQSAFTLNDLHMGKQQLESTVKELREKLGHATEQGREARGEVSELRRSLQEREEQLFAARAELRQAGERGAEGGGEELAAKERESEELRKELAEMRNSHEKVMSEDYEGKMENRRLKTEVEEAAGRAEELGRQVREGQAALSRLALEKDTRIEIGRASCRERV